MQPAPSYIVPAKLSALHTIVTRPWVGIVLFKLNWLLLVAGEHRWMMLVAFFILMLQTLAVLPAYASDIRHYRVLQRCLLFACFGVVVDQVLSFAGVLIFPSRWLPAWLVALWLAFALVLPHLTPMLLRLPLYTWSLIGAAGGLLSYRTGAALGAVTLAQPLWLSSTVLALVWAVMLPLWRALVVKPGSKPGLSQIAGCICALVVMLSSAPSPVVAADDDLSLVGQAHFRYLVWPVYDATLKAAQLPFDFPRTVPFELSLVYKRDFSSAQIIEETRRQWQRQNTLVQPEWQQWLPQAIPDVQAGDKLTLRVDAQYASHFFHNQQRMTTIADSDFTIAFAGIWLGTNTTAPRLRAQLLGTPP